MHQPRKTANHLKKSNRFNSMNRLLTSRPTRRRALTILAGAAMGGLVASPAPAAPSDGDRIWEGVALGADARIVLQGFTSAAAETLIADCQTEVARLEAVFSLHDKGSALARLNRHGHLADAPDDLLDLVAHARRFHVLSGGAFDPSVQPLWELYAAHFRDRPADENGPSADAVSAAVARIGFERVGMGGRSLTLPAGMSLTLNGIAQGYITDRVTDLLRARGARHVLVDLGEFRAAGTKLDGRPWRVGLRNPVSPLRLDGDVPLTANALATSGGYGTHFDAKGRYHHLFDPRTGACARRTLSVSVVAPTATEADALSTAFSIMDRPAIAGVLKELPQTGVRLVDADGKVRLAGAWPAA